MSCMFAVGKLRTPKSQLKTENWRPENGEQRANSEMVAVGGKDTYT